MADLAESLADHYEPDEYPALQRQIIEWTDSRPLDGLRVLDASPIFRNTMTKYLALQRGGAQITVARGPGIPSDETVVSRLPGFGIRVADAAASNEEYDIVFDCAGAYAGTRARIGTSNSPGPAGKPTPAVLSRSFSSTPAE